MAPEKRNASAGRWRRLNVSMLSAEHFQQITHDRQENLAVGIVGARWPLFQPLAAVIRELVHIRGAA